MIEYDDLVGARHVELITRFFVQHILIERPVTQERDLIFQMFALRLQDRKLFFTRDTLMLERLRCAQP